MRLDSGFIWNCAASAADLLQDYHRWWIIAAAAIGAVVGSKLPSSLVSLTATSIGGNTRER